jgi:regulator of sigma E protease
VSSFPTLRTALRRATQDAYAQKAGAEVTLEVRLPIGDDYTTGPETSLKWSLTADDVQTLHILGWRSPVDPLLFKLDTTLDQTSNPIAAVGRGIAETRRMMITTYLTFVRLFQGTVQVDQLKGPVGIAHLGTQIVDQGFLNLLFFLGLISVNLAVINFLPIPIADGGHFVMLSIEQITGKPVSPVIENITSLAGLALIATVFIVVTYNDIAALIGG